MSSQLDEWQLLEARKIADACRRARIEAVGLKQYLQELERREQDADSSAQPTSMTNDDTQHDGDA